MALTNADVERIELAADIVERIERQAGMHLPAPNPMVAEDRQRKADRLTRVYCALKTGWPLKG